MRNKYKIKKIEGETFSFPLLLLEELANTNIDIVIVRGNEQMWLNSIDYLIFRECDEIDDGWYKQCVFKFIPDDKTLNQFQLALCNKFHETYLNHAPFWEYVNSRAFVDLLSEIANMRKNNVITPEKDEVFKMFLQPRKSFELPTTLTFNKGVEMNDSWYEFLNIC